MHDFNIAWDVQRVAEVIYHALMASLVNLRYKIITDRAAQGLLHWKHWKIFTGGWTLVSNCWINFNPFRCYLPDQCYAWYLSSALMKLRFERETGPNCRALATICNGGEGASPARQNIITKR